MGSDKVIRGKENYISNMKDNYKQIPDWRFDVVEIFSNGNKVAVEFLGRGHFTGEYLDCFYRNVPLELRAVCIFVFQENKIWEEIEYWDPKGFERQLTGSKTR